MTTPDTFAALHIPTPQEARKIAQRFIDGHFDNPGTERPCVSIPADPKRDDDLRLMAFIEWAAQQAATIEQLRAELAESRSNGAQFRASMYAVEERCIELRAERDEAVRRVHGLGRIVADQRAMIEAAESALAKSRQETIAECAAVADEVASLQRNDRWTALGDGGAVSWFATEAEAVAAGKRIFRKKFVRAVNNGPRDLECCEESAAEIRDRILALTSTERREAGEVER